MNISFSHSDSLIWVVVFILATIILLLYLNRSKNNGLIYIIVSRFVAALILIVLFFDPRFNIIKESTRDLRWNIYIDRSSSMSHHSNYSVSTLASGIDEIIDKIKKKGIRVNTFGFGADIDTLWEGGDKSFKDISTNISQIIQHMKNQNNSSSLAGSILFTDGQINQGSEIITEDLKILKPIHVIGVGSKNPLVDVAIHSIDAPPVIIKGENAEIQVKIISQGDVNQRLNVTLRSDKKLLGSKVMGLKGKGSLNKVKFMLRPEQTGEINYIVQVNALPDEVNIMNNKQVVPIQVLKDQYNIAMITGAPSFNTKVIKTIISENKKYNIDHYYYRNNNYSNPLKKFWDTKYDLILFDNHPIDNNANEWTTYVRIFAKKILSQKSSFAIFIGHDTNLDALTAYLNLMDLKLKDPLIELGDKFEWKFTENWELLFPFNSKNLISTNEKNYPPLFVDLQIDSSSKGQVLAEFAVSGVNIPLITAAEKTPLRYMVWTSPDLNKLYYKTQNNKNQSLTNQVLGVLLSWLMRTGSGQDFYFRPSKNSYQQGEQVIVSGKPANKLEEIKDGYIHVFHNNEKINTKPLTYDKEKGLYSGKFWASKSGKLNYDIEITYGNQPLVASRGEVIVQESKIELNNVFLNKEPLLELSTSTGGSYYDWGKKNSLISEINQKSKKEIASREIILHESWVIFFTILFLVTLEWVLRKKYGMI